MQDFCLVTVPPKTCLNWGYKPSRICCVESRLHHVVLKDVFDKHSILLGAAILCNGLFAAFFVCFSSGVREEFFLKDGMISEIIDEGPCPVRVIHPFNVGGACGGGRRGVGCLLRLLLLMFGLSHVWRSEVGRQLGERSWDTKLVGSTLWLWRRFGSQLEKRGPTSDFQLCKVGIKVVIKVGPQVVLPWNTLFFEAPLPTGTLDERTFCEAGLASAAFLAPAEPLVTVYVQWPCVTSLAPPAPLWQKVRLDFLAIFKLVFKH